jgi:tripartite-type tricarboxylate transporter receptor subunit TctC
MKIANWRCRFCHFFTGDFMKLTTRIVAQAALLLTLGANAFANEASTFPTRPIKIVVAFPAGGGPDPMARIVAAGLEQRLGQPVIIENVPGASGALAARSVTRSKPDGYTLMFTDMSFVVAPLVTAGFGVDPLKEFKPIGWVAAAPFSFIVSSSVPASNVADFVKLAKADPQNIIIGHTGIGTTPYLGAISFTNSAEIQPRLIPYKGIGDATANAMTGIISGLFSAASTAIGVQGNDKVKVLGITGDKRMPQLPNVPSFSESNIKMPGFEHGAWFGLVAPAGTSDAIIERINKTLNDIKEDDKAKARFAAAGAEFKGGTVAQFGDFLTKQHAHWKDTLQKVGVKPN